MMSGITALMAGGGGGVLNPWTYTYQSASYTSGSLFRDGFDTLLGKGVLINESRVDDIQINGSWLRGGRFYLRTDPAAGLLAWSTQLQVTYEWSGNSRTTVLVYTPDFAWWDSNTDILNPIPSVGSIVTVSVKNI